MSVNLFPVTNSYPDFIEMNVANGNANIVLAMLGVEPDSVGPSTQTNIPAEKMRDVLDKLANIDPANFVRQTVLDAEDKTKMPIVHCGISEDRLEHYKVHLMILVSFCLGRNCALTWA